MEPSMPTLERAPVRTGQGRTGYLIVAGLGSILLLHLFVLATTHAKMNESRASVILQAVSLACAAFFAGRAALGSRDFARHFWTLAFAGFALLFAAFLYWRFVQTNIGLSSFLFLLHMAPFGVMLMLNDQPGDHKLNHWPILLDYGQILLIAVILFAGYVYIPSRGATPEQMQALYRTYAALFVTRNVIVTGGFWTRALLAESRREFLAFRTMGIYLLVYSLGSILGHTVNLSVHPAFHLAPGWLDLQGSVPALTAAWLFSRWNDLPPETLPQRTRLRSALTAHWLPSILPLIVAVLAFSLGKREPALVWFLWSLSLVLFAFRWEIESHT